MKISIITASYNYAEYIEETINSVINQSYQDWQLIIVDDGSSDNSVEIIKSYCEKDSRIKLFQHAGESNKGLKETLLLGISHACGDWIAFLESDDFFAPDNLIKKLEIIEKCPDVKLVFNKVDFLWDENRKKSHQKIFENTQEKLSKMSFPRNMFKDFYINNMILTFSCVMVEANILRNANFSTPVDTFLDWWLWIHLAYKNDFYYIDEELTSWRLHQKSYIKSKKPALHFLQAKAYYDVYKNNGKPLSFLVFMLFSNVKLFFVVARNVIAKQSFK
jgi:glycosyltransferase involved in cell wall biosynthesis